MRDFGDYFSSNEARIAAVGGRLREGAAEWFMQLHDANTPELKNFEGFMNALRKRFGDPLEKLRAKTALQQLRQGNKHVRICCVIQSPGRESEQLV